MTELQTQQTTALAIFPTVPEDRLPMPAADLVRIAEAIRRADLSVVRDVDDMKVALAFRDVMKAGKDELESLRKAQVEDLKKQTSAIDTFFRGFRRPIEEAMLRLDEKENAFRREQRRLAEEEAARQRKIDEERTLAEAKEREEHARLLAEEAARLEAAGKGDEAQAAMEQAIAKAAEADHIVNEAIDAPPPPVLVGPTKFNCVFGGKSTERREWAYEEVDFEKIPREWLMVDSAKVIAAIRRKDNPVRSIPGLRIFENIKSRHG